ncbi:MAG TPA: DUF1810 domain-containing protein [Terriglobales bacterium]|nr:DUF1810 domain-containing protein [Terriglobales bacterium]
MPHDEFNLERFLEAQQHVIDSVYSELRSGHKRGHWMWFIFPQLKGLGHSENSEYYGIASLAEAAAYLDHPLLGTHLRECTELVNAIQGLSAAGIFGPVDAVKFRSSMTLFSKATREHEIFTSALEKYFAGELDPLTLALL